MLLTRARYISPRYLNIANGLQLGAVRHLLHSGPGSGNAAHSCPHSHNSVQNGYGEHEVLQKLNIEMSTRKTPSSSLWPPVDTTIIWSALSTGLREIFKLQFSIVSKYILNCESTGMRFQQGEGSSMAFFGHCEIREVPLTALLFTPVLTKM